PQPPGKPWNAEKAAVGFRPHARCQHEVREQFVSLEAHVRHDRTHLRRVARYVLSLYRVEGQERQEAKKNACPRRISQSTGCVTEKRCGPSPPASAGASPVQKRGSIQTKRYSSS